MICELRFTMLDCLSQSVSYDQLVSFLFKLVSKITVFINETQNLIWLSTYSNLFKHKKPRY